MMTARERSPLTPSEQIARAPAVSAAAGEFFESLTALTADDMERIVAAVQHHAWSGRAYRLIDTTRVLHRILTSR